ncbi:MAG: hypothetical protein ACTS4V_01325 [Candidatus Hodgkinia cicadicola]
MKVFSFCKTLSKTIRRRITTSFVPGKVVTGFVTFKCNEFALIEIGTSKNATLRSNGSWKYENLEVGNSIKVYIESVGENNEDVHVSRRELDLDETWDMVDNLCKTKEEVLAKVIGINRNGIEMEVFNMFGAIFWNKEIIKLENELRKRSVLMARVRATCRRHNMIVLTPSRPIEDNDERRPNCTVWTEVIGLCDKGIWTLVDGCNGIITLSGKPWCKALDLINRMPFGEVILSDFVKLEQTTKLKRSWDLIDLIVNYVMEINDGTKWDESIDNIDAICVWEWVISLAPVNRKRWHEWRERSNLNSKLRFRCGSFNGPAENKLRSECLNEVYNVIKAQNRLWSAERNELEKLLCGFEWERFKLTKYVLETLVNRISSFDRKWLEQMKSAWLNEEKGFASAKGKWQTFPRWERRKIIERLQCKRNVKGNSFNLELEWGNERKLRDKERLNVIQAHSAEKGGKEDDEKRSGKLRSESWNNGKEKRKTEDINMEEEINKLEQELNAEWEMEWYLKRGPQVWERHYTQTESSVIETSYGNLNGIRTLRAAYGVIIGLDVQVKMLAAAVNGKLIAYVCDFSLNNEEVTSLGTKWKDDCAIKMAPVGLSYSLDDVLVEISVEGYLYLKFVEERTNQSLVGKVVSIGKSETTIELENGIYGKLRFTKTADKFGIEIGMEVDVMITDFNPVTNDINLELSEEEEVRTILVET